MDKKRNPRQTARTVDGEPSSAYFFDETASANEFTGCVPTPPPTDADAESYLDLLGVPITSTDGGEKKRRIWKKRK